MAVSKSHWIWYIFPQIKGLGRSYQSEYYGIASRQEAEAYLAEPTLNARLREITLALLDHKNKTAQQILGGIDAMKVKSSMTLFDAIVPNDIYADIVERGIYLAGGGALPHGLAKRLTDKFHIQFHVADDPLHSVAKGTCLALKNTDNFSFLIRN